MIFCPAAGPEGLPGLGAAPFAASVLTEGFSPHDPRDSCRIGNAALSRGSGFEFIDHAAAEILFLSLDGAPRPYISPGGVGFLALQLP